MTSPTVANLQPVYNMPIPLRGFRGKNLADVFRSKKKGLQELVCLVYIGYTSFQARRILESELLE
jgi:hypothetical protein